jgi:PPOX class probable F420-dependent enzyme
MSVLPDSDFGTRVRDRLQHETIVWFTTTSANGTPQPNPVWFLWDADTESALIYNANDAKRLEHVAVRPRVSLNFQADADGGDVVVLTGVAEQALDVPPVHENDAYLAKYASAIDGISGDAETFARTYSVPLRVRITKVRGF